MYIIYKKYDHITSVEGFTKTDEDAKELIEILKLTHSKNATFHFKKAEFWNKDKIRMFSNLLDDISYEQSNIEIA